MQKVPVISKRSLSLLFSNSFLFCGGSVLKVQWSACELLKYIMLKLIQRLLNFNEFLNRTVTILRLENNFCCFKKQN